MIGPPGEEIEEKIKSKEIRPLILNLYSPDRGYSVTLPGLNCVDCKTRDFSYEDDYEFLEFIENNELPMVVIDLIEKYCVGNVFYKGCIAVEVRDYRTGDAGSSPPTTSEACESKMYFLRPTVQSLTDDLNGLLNEDSLELNVEERKKLESSFWKLISNNLCFETTPGTSRRDAAFETSYCSRVLSRKRKMRSEIELINENELKSFKFIKSCSLTRRDASPVVDLLKPANSQTSQWKPMLPSTKTPPEIADKRLSTLVETDIDDSRTLIEEYQIEFASTPTPNAAELARCNKTKIVISRRKSDWVYFGELIVERNEEMPVRSNFLIGTEWQSKLYISQYLDMVSEGGRRSLTLTRLTPGKPAHVLTSKPGSSFTSNRASGNNATTATAAAATCDF